MRNLLLLLLLSQGAGPKRRQNFGTSCMSAHSMRNNNRILHGDQTRCEDFFTGSTTNADARSVSVDKLLAVARLSA